MRFILALFLALPLQDSLASVMPHVKAGNVKVQ